MMFPTVSLRRLMHIEEMAEVEVPILEAAPARKTEWFGLDQPREFSIQQATSLIYIRQAALGIVVSTVTQRGTFSFLS